MSLRSGHAWRVSSVIGIRVVIAMLAGWGEVRWEMMVGVEKGTEG